MFDRLAADVRLAVRRFHAQPAVAALTVLTLGLGVGAATAIFSVANAVLLRPLPYPQADRLVRLVEATETAGVQGVSFPAFDLWASEVPSLESVAFYESRSATVLVGDEPDRLPGATVSRSFFDVLRAAPQAGRPLAAGPLLGPPDEAIISHALWQRLGGHDGVLGRTIRIDPRTYTIVGVMPPGFDFPADAQFWTTAPADMEKIRALRNIRFLRAIGRLRPDASVEGLAAELAVLTARHPARAEPGGEVRMEAAGLQDEMTREVRPGILLAMGAVAILLLIACANLAALLLAQAASRHRELVVQAALGADRGRLARERFTEVLALAVPAGLLGLAAAWWLRDIIVGLSAGEIPRIEELTLDARVFAFALAATAGAALLASLLPARFAADMASGLPQARGASQPRGVAGMLRALVVAEVALTFVVASAGVLLARSYDRLTRVDTGFSADGTLAMRLNLPLQPPVPRDAQLAFYEEVAARARAVPGVTEAGYVSRLPLATSLANLEVTGVGGAGAVRSTFQIAGPGYFAAIGADIVEGRELADADRTAPAVVVSDILARQLFPGTSAVGRRVTFQHWTGPVDAEIVGVSRPIRYNDLTSESLPEMYLDYRARPAPVYLALRTSGAAATLPAIREIVRAADPTGRITIDQVTSLERELARRLARPTFFLALTGTFAVVAILLAAGGLYGVMAYAVTARRRDLGIRLALGASPRRVAREVAASGAALTMGGLVLGGVAAVFVTRLTASLLFEVTPGEPITYVLAAVLLAGIAMAACLVPALRAGRVDPLEVLRAEG